MIKHFIPRALAFIFLLVALPASAETVSRTLRKWGLIGSWAADCAAPRDKASALLSYEITADDRVIVRRDFGTGSDEQEVSSAEIAADGVLVLRIFYPAFKQTRENGIAMQPDGTIRAIYNRNEKDDYSIRDGKFVASGHPSIALHKCAPRG